MSDLRDEIVAMLAAAPLNRCTQAKIIDEMALRTTDFSLEELDTVIETLRDEGAIRIRNPRGPVNDRIIELLE